MDSQKRLLTALGLSFLLTVVYVTFFARPPPAGEPGTAIDAGSALSIAAGSADAGTEAVGVPAQAPAEAAEAPPVREVTRDRRQVHVALSSEGAGLTRAELQGPKMREQTKVSLGEGFGRLLGKVSDKAPQMNVAQPTAGLPLPLAISVAGAQPLAANARYAVDDSHPDRVSFKARTGSWEVEKTLEWLDAEGLELRLTVQLKNVGAAPVSGELGVHYSRAIDPGHEEAGSFFGGVGNQSHAACYVNDKLEKRIPDKEPKPIEHKGPIHYFGVDQQYFLASVHALDAPREGRCVLEATPTVRVANAFFPIQVAPGAVVTQKFGVYLGPKDVDALAAVSGSSSGNAGGGGYLPLLEKTVDFSWWAVICKVLLSTMKIFHNLTGNWGVAIILLTVAVKILLLPLTHKQMVSAEAMKKLQPRMEEIKKKYPDDRERQNVETMKMYQEAKVNPLGGCLPLLVQFPIWGALYTTLRVSYELYREPFIAPVWTDLTYKDPTYLIPVLLGVTMIITQKLQPQMMDAAQARMMTYVMPIFFTAIMLNYPAGLGLYIFTNNLLTIVQQYGLRKYLEKKGVVEPRLQGKAKGRA